MRHPLLSGLAAALILSGGIANAQTDDEAFRDAFLAGDLDWNAVLARAAEEGEVNLYYWGGSDLLNIWMDSVVTPEMAALGVRFNAVRITSAKDVVDLIIAERNSGKDLGQGSVDAMWVNGENFATLKAQDALFGPFATLLPNARNIDWNPDDPRATLNLRDFGVETGGAEMPWSGEQYVCAVNTARVDAADVPHTFADLRAYLEANPGKFAYVKPPHYLGNTFVQEAIYAHNPDGTGAAPLQSSIDEVGSEELARLITPGLQYLKDLEPFLLGAGGKARYPEDGATLDGLFLNGEVDFNCKFGLYAVAVNLSTGAYPEGAEAFVFPQGNMIKNKNYIMIPGNTSHPAAALVLADHLASVESQISKLDAVGHPAGIDAWMLSEADAAALAAASPGLVGVMQEELDANAAPDTNATLVDVIEATWLEYIERGSDAPIADIVARAVANLAR